MYRLAICEDETMLREALHGLCHSILERMGVEHEIAAYSSAEELETALSTGARFDLLCLDIIMTGKTGMDLAIELRKWDNQTSILFVTSSTDYLLEGYNARPLQYLLKPVKEDALEKALRTDLQLNHRQKTVTLRVGGKTTVLALGEILYVASQDHGCNFYMDQGEQFFWMNLAHVEKLVPANQFCRCHNSYLVNLGRIQEMGNRSVTLSDGTQLSIGRRYAEQFQRQFVRFLNSREA